MTINNIRNRIHQFFAENHNITNDLFDADIYDDLGLDSLGFVQLIVFCEDTFGYKFDIAEMDFEKLRTINSISETIFKGVDCNETKAAI